MSGRKNMLITAGIVCAVSLIAAAMAVLLVSGRCRALSFELLDSVCSEVVEREPETLKTISAALKAQTRGNLDGALVGGVLSQLGYRASDFSGSPYRQNVLFALAGFAAGFSLFLFTFCYRNRAESRRIRALAAYLEQVNSGKAVILSTSGEDDFSKLEDEIYKTVTCLYQMKEQAVRTKNDFAESLSDIAHQIKTPITAICLSVQRMRQGSPGNGLAQVEIQLSRLTNLVESLLILSRLDAGVLPFHKEETDVFTLLVLAADNLQELFAGTGTSVEIPEQGQIRIDVDMEWTMEAIMNLMKNCMEHSTGGTVHCSYAQNPLYTEILIWDNGEGFAKEDLPHLFERFYRGKNAGEGGIGIGLALAKEMIERQNGTLRAKNRPGGGAVFEIRFYRH